MAGSGSYSLWVMPTGELAQQLQQQIDRIAGEFGAPVFEPHVTLLGGVHKPEAEVLSVAADLAARLQPYQLEFQDVHFGETVYQCVYIRIRPQPDVLHVGAETRAAYGADSDEAYMPHVSLLYSNISQDARKALAEQLQHRLLQEASSPITQRSFTASELHVWYTEEGDPNLTSWRRVGHFALTGAEVTSAKDDCAPRSQSTS